MTNLDNILKIRDITLLTQVHLVKAMVFLVVMYGCESWIVMKAKCRRIDGFELWCYRRLCRVPWTARRSNQSILKEISPGCSLEGLMLKLKLQYFGHQWDKIENPEINPCIYGYLIFDKGGKNMLLLPLSHFSRVQLCATQWTAAHEAPPSLEFSRQQHWSRLPFPSPMHESEK